MASVHYTLLWDLPNYCSLILVFSLSSISYNATYIGGLQVFKLKTHWNFLMSQNWHNWWTYITIYFFIAIGVSNNRSFFGF